MLGSLAFASSANASNGCAVAPPVVPVVGAGVVGAGYDSATACQALAARLAQMEASMSYGAGVSGYSQTYGTRSLEQYQTQTPLAAPAQAAYGASAYGAEAAYGARGYGASSYGAGAYGAAPVTAPCPPRLARLGYGNSFAAQTGFAGAGYGASAAFGTPLNYGAGIGNVGYGAGIGYGVGAGFAPRFRAPLFRRRAFVPGFGAGVGFGIAPVVPVTPVIIGPRRFFAPRVIVPGRIGHRGFIGNRGVFRR